MANSFLRVLIVLAVLCASPAVFADAAADKAAADKAAADKAAADKAAAEKKAVDKAVAKALAEKAAAEKKVADEKKKAEAAKRAEEEKKKQDDPANWKPKDFESTKIIPHALCVYIKDPDQKKNTTASELEGKELLGSSEVRAKLRAFTRIKIKNNATDAKGWPDDWLKRAENGAVLVLVSSDGVELAIFDHRTPKTALTTAAIEKAIESITKRDEDQKVSAAQKVKDEAARAAALAPPPPAREKELPGLDGKKSVKTAETPKKKDVPDE